MKHIVSALFGVALLLAVTPAHAVPTTVAFTGRLTTSSGPVNGTVASIKFTLFDQLANGNVKWTETRTNITADQGLVYADLGSLTTLDETILTNNPLFLEIQVGTEVLTPRLPLQSVPYAIRSEVANSADLLGTIAPGDVVTGVTGGGGVNATKAGNNVTLSVDANMIQSRVTGTCAAGSSINSINSNGTVGCQTSLTTESDGIIGNEVTGNTDTTLVRNGAGTAVSPYTLAVDTNFIQKRVNGTCAAGSSIRAIDAAGNVTCDASNDDTVGNEVVGAGDTSLTLSGTGTKSDPLTLSVNDTVMQRRVGGPCGVGSSIRGIAQDGSVVCEPDTALAGGGCVWAVNPGTVAQSFLRAVCPAGKSVISGGCFGAAGVNVTGGGPINNSSSFAPNNGDSVTAADSWHCNYNTAVAGNRAFALCCDIN